MKCLRLSILVLSLLMAVFRVQGEERKGWGSAVIPAAAAAALGAGFLTRKLVNAYRDTILGWAIKQNIPTTIIKTMIAMGANVNAVSRDGELTPLHLAAEKGDLGVVRALLEKDAKVNAGNLKQWTPLHFAAEKGDLGVVMALLEKGANVDAVDNTHRWTPLHVAAGKGNTKVVMALLEKGAKADVVNRYRWTPLHVAAKKGDLEVVMALLEKGANVDVVNDVGHSALGYAIMDTGNPQLNTKRQDVAQLLMKWGADEKIGMPSTLTPEEKKRLERVKKLIKIEQQEALKEAVPGLPHDLARLISEMGS